MWSVPEVSLQALAIVEQLYNAGATKVVVPPDSIQPVPDVDGEYADALIVVLPEDSAAKNRLIEIGNSESERDEMELGPETRHGLIFLWWDSAFRGVVLLMAH
ncbi:MAG: hypothetical protein K9L70_09785 [Thiohalocapsa sp.]|nr:hypothetical protein [Thiohalocapsa sp.]MCF7992739.1 hypothetical protein [Thiohalocapsa sp.]